MNPNANTFIPIQKDHHLIPMTNLSKKQMKILQDLISEWTAASTLNNVLTNWKKRRQQTLDMLNVKNELSFLSLNISTLKLYLYDLFELLNSLQVSVIVLNGTRHDKDTLKYFSMYLSNFQVFFQNGSNAFGGVLVATRHASNPNSLGLVSLVQ